MAKRRRTTGETLQETIARQQKTAIADHSLRPEKVAWDRKMGNLQKILDELRPIEDGILDLTMKKEVLVQELVELRKDMVQECIHPFDMLVEQDGITTCKFCNRRLVTLDHD